MLASDAAGAPGLAQEQIPGLTDVASAIRTVLVQCCGAQWLLSRWQTPGKGPGNAEVFCTQLSQLAFGTTALFEAFTDAKVVCKWTCTVSMREEGHCETL